VLQLEVETLPWPPVIDAFGLTAAGASGRATVRAFPAPLHLWDRPRSRPCRSPRRPERRNACGYRGAKECKMASSAATPSCTREAVRRCGHWLRRKANSLFRSFSLRPVTSLAQMSNVAGLAGTTERSAAFIAASVAGDSKAGVSSTTRLTLCWVRALNSAGSLAAETAWTGRLYPFVWRPIGTGIFWDPCRTHKHVLPPLEPRLQDKRRACFCRNRLFA
jgi:hypothetical protein